MDLNEIAIFIKVVQTGSFSQAAKLLAMPKSTVSMKISNLEKRLSTTLIQRTTRKLNITPAGQTFYQRCLLGLEEMKAAESELFSLHSEPQGLLRITAPLDLGSSILPGIISDFTNKYPKVEVDVLLTDRRVDLLSENVDLAIRAGHLQDSTLIAKKLGSVYFAPFASPKYLKTHPGILKPKDLLFHLGLHFSPGGTSDWKLNGPKGNIDVPVKSKVTINNLMMIKAMTLMGEGVGFLPTYFCYPEVKSGKLIRLLPEWKSALTPVHFIYASQKFVSPKLSAFIALANGPLKNNFESYEI